MLLLTWHATLLRLERETNRLTHARLVPRRDIATDFVMELPTEGLNGPLLGPDGLTLHPGEVPGTVHLRRLGKYLRISAEPYPDFTADTAGPWETLWLVTQDDVDRLRDLLTHSWVQAGSGTTLHPGDFAMLGGPLLRLGAQTLDLATTRPSADPGTPHRLSFPAITLDRVPGSHAPPREIPIIRQPPDRTPEVPTEAAFHATCPARYTLPAPPELAHPPILGSLADRDFVYRRAWRGLRQASGRIHLQSQVVRARDTYVLLARGAEGMILDEAGVFNEPDYIGGLAAAAPPWLSHEAGRRFLDHALLARAPVLRGPHAVFYNGGYHNYYHWLIDSLLPLTLMAPLLPAGTTLLLPGTLAQFRDKPIGRLDYIEALTAFGFGDMPRAEIPGEICQVEELYWPDRCTIAEIPACVLQAARDRATAQLPPPAGPRQRLFIHRIGTRAIANARHIERLIDRLGFTPVLMEDFTATEQIALFRQAEMVVGTHGAALANLLFCPPGTPVIELSPDCEYRPFFNEMAAKLGLTHAVLPCPTDDGSFNGRLTVEPARLGGLIRMLQLRRAA
jgi:hypothetical protein